MVVCYQGEPGSFSEEAARHCFGRSAKLVPCENFRAVFRTVSRRQATAGIVPIENTVLGSIHQTYDLLLEHHLAIIGETQLRIRLNLLALPGTRPRDIRKIYSQPQALGQCEDFLRSLGDVEVHAFHDTAAAARMIREERMHDAAAIASARAGRRHRLAVLRADVESHRQNYTRFIVIGRRAVRAVRNPRTSVVFAARDLPGALFKALAVFSLRDINLRKIESRPLIGRPWQYLFYLDVDGSPDEARVTQALEHLRELSIFVRVLGTYERALTPTDRMARGRR